MRCAAADVVFVMQHLKTTNNICEKIKIILQDFPAWKFKKKKKAFVPLELVIF